MHTTAYIFIDLADRARARARAVGRLSGIFGKFDKKLSPADGTENCSNGREQSR